jgi:hypothetical protein
MDQDHEQTDSMHSAEHELWSAAAIVLINLWRQYGEDNWDSCILSYLKYIQERLAEEITIAHIAVANHKEPSVIHLHWCIVAFYHQELDLRTQGRAAWSSAVKDGALIMYGRA